MLRFCVLHIKSAESSQVPGGQANALVGNKDTSVTSDTYLPIYIYLLNSHEVYYVYTYICMYPGTFHTHVSSILPFTIFPALRRPYFWKSFGGGT